MSAFNGSESFDMAVCNGSDSTKSSYSMTLTSKNNKQE